MEDKDFLVGRFCGVTGVSRERATFYLEAAGWNLESAMGAFYDATNEEEEDLVEPEVPQSSGLSSGAGETSSTAPVPAGNSGGRRGVATLSDYKNKPTDSKDAQQFYAGGSEHSGQMIEGPPRPNDTPKNITQGFIDAAKKQGAVPVEEEETEEGQQRARPFQGAGFKLGDTDSPSPSVGTRGTLPPPPRPEKVRHTLILWKDGFSVDDGALRTGQTDEDKQFIESVQKGEIPEELRRHSRHGEVDVDIKDQRDQSYVRPKPKMVAFSGEGRKLGSYAPSVISSSSGASNSSNSASNVATPTATPPATVPLDPSQPTTSLQIRLADGTRLTAKFNHTHTVNDVRQFIDLSRPGTVNYVLMTTFPNKELSDPTLTLSQANLLNAVIVQRIR